MWRLDELRHEDAARSSMSYHGDVRGGSWLWNGNLREAIGGDV
jgi:hypothetical protein